MKTVRFISLFGLIILSFTACSNANDPNKTFVVENEGDTVKLKTIVVDVRTPDEWVNDGHANCTVNYPLDVFETKIDSLRQYDRIVLVCRSGSRANAAKNMLEDAGIKNVENKGSWQNIECK
ncbi:MAG: rhodanese-like domain-containing protein [Ferruginibacter sp.]|nr:rhodanese-like domain-containing protein [Ferruginibacter sp.]